MASGWAQEQRGALQRQVEALRESAAWRVARRWGVGLGIALALAVPAGAILGLLDALYGSAALIALAIGYLMLRSVLVGLVCLVSIICLLPFAAFPINLGFTPTFLDAILLVVFFVWVSRLATRQQGEFIAVPPTLPVLIFLGLAVVSFIAGLSHGRLSANLLRHFAEILLSVLLFVLVINVVRTQEQLRWVVLALLVAGFLAALIGVVLYYLPEELTIRLLSSLRVVRYPSGQEVLRYVEDNNELPLRATSTSVDPNVLGGMLIFVCVLMAAQVLTAKPILPRRFAVPMLAVMGFCMILTFSRGSFVGLAVAAALMGLLRYRKALWLMFIVLALLLLLPPAQVYVQRFIEGVQGQDLATQMRYGEYSDAFILIARYPWFGVGFSGTPDIDTYLGVSSVYLLIAQEMGVLGLLAFLAALVSYLVSFVTALRRCRPGSELEPILLGTGLAVAGGAVGGLLDHYLFNLDFPHAAALLWLIIGLGAVSIRLVRQEAGDGEQGAGVRGQL